MQWFHISFRKYSTSFTSSLHCDFIFSSEKCQKLLMTTMHCNTWIRPVNLWSCFKDCYPGKTSNHKQNCSLSEKWSVVLRTEWVYQTISFTCEIQILGSAKTGNSVSITIPCVWVSYCYCHTSRVWYYSFGKNMLG
jgi:hypothetical protein